MSFRRRNGILTDLRFSGAETDPRRNPVGHTVELSAGNMRVDERMLEERPEREAEVHRHTPAFEQRDQPHRNGQPAAQAARVAGHRRSPEHQENPVRRAVGRGQLPAAGRPGRARRIPEHMSAAAGGAINRYRGSGRPARPRFRPGNDAVTPRRDAQSRVPFGTRPVSAVRTGSEVTVDNGVDSRSLSSRPEIRVQHRHLAIVVPVTSESNQKTIIVARSACSDAAVGFRSNRSDFFLVRVHPSIETLASIRSRVLEWCRPHVLPASLIAKAPSRRHVSFVLKYVRPDRMINNTRRRGVKASQSRTFGRNNATDHQRYPSRNTIVILLCR